MTQLLTLAEYRDAPTAMNSQDLVAGGVQADQDAALATAIRRASGWMENYCNQPLVAAQRTVTEQVRARADGSLALAPGTWPVSQLVSLSTGTTGADLAAVTDLTGVWISEQSFIVPSPWPASGTAVIQLATPRLGAQVLARYTYVSGWPNTTLTNPAGAAATSLTVASAVGIAAGQTLTIYDGANTEDVAVSTVAGSTLTVPATAHVHAAGVSVSGLPDELKFAAVLATSAVIRSRGNDALVLTQLTAPGGIVGQDPVGSADLRLVREILASYRRVR